MTISYKDGSTLRTITGVSYKDGSTLRTITDAWYKDGSTLRKIFTTAAAVTVTVSGATISDVNELYGIASVRFNSDGTVDQGNSNYYSQINAATDWGRPVSEAPGSYQIRAQLVSGSASNVYGAALNTWHALTSSRAWTVVAGYNQLRSVTLRISIREGTGAILDTGDYILSAQGLPP